MSVLTSGTVGLCHNSSTEHSHHGRETRRVLCISRGEERCLSTFMRISGGRREAGEFGGLYGVVGTWRREYQVAGDATGSSPEAKRLLSSSSPSENEFTD